VGAMEKKKTLMFMNFCGMQIKYFFKCVHQCVITSSTICWSRMQNIKKVSWMDMEFICVQGSLSWPPQPCKSHCQTTSVLTWS
jgi:hypothetical protein